MQGFSPRGLDIDRNGVVWTVLASGHLASFDRRKCKGPLNGPTATGQHCPEGWSLYQLPGPQFENVKLAGSAEYPYYVWVDQFNTFGLGANVPIATGNGNDALLALVNGKFVVLRVPYPMGFFAKNVDGRFDDPEYRLERQRLVDHRWNQNAVSHGGRQRLASEGRPLPAYVPIRWPGKLAAV